MANQGANHMLIAPTDRRTASFVWNLALEEAVREIKDTMRYDRHILAAVCDRITSLSATNEAIIEDPSTAFWRAFSRLDQTSSSTPPVRQP